MNRDSAVGTRLPSSNELVDYNLEYAHIYVDAPGISDEHIQATGLAVSKIAEIAAAGCSHISTVLVDDYNPQHWCLSIDELADGLDGHGLKPDIIIYESALVQLGRAMLMELDGRAKRSQERYLRERGKYSCSLLVSAWHLARLGFLESSAVLFADKKVAFAARNAITILPVQYSRVEEKACSLISTTRFADAVRRMEYVYF